MRNIIRFQKKPVIQNDTLEYSGRKNRHIEKTVLKRDIDKINLMTAAINEVNKRIRNIDVCLAYEFLSAESKDYLLSLRKEYTSNIQSYIKQLNDMMPPKVKHKQECKYNQSLAKSKAKAEDRFKSTQLDNTKQYIKIRSITTKSSIWPVEWPKKK